MTALVVLHDLGDGNGGRAWDEAFVGAGWSGPVVAPDLPGHAGTAPPVGGNHEPADGAFVLVRLLAAEGLDELEGSERPVIVGVGVNGWCAELAALAGLVSALVLVDGLGGPWIDPGEAVAADLLRFRAVAADPAAVAPMAGDVQLDPRLAHDTITHTSLEFSLSAARAMPVPVFVVESPRSGTPRSDADVLTAAMAAGGVLVEVDDPSPETVAAAVVAALTTTPF